MDAFTAAYVEAASGQPRMTLAITLTGTTA